MGKRGKKKRSALWSAQQTQLKAFVAKQNMTLAVIKVRVSTAGDVEAQVFAGEIKHYYSSGAIEKYHIEDKGKPLFTATTPKDKSMTFDNRGHIINPTVGKTAVLECVQWCLENGRHRYIIDDNLTNRPAHESASLGTRRARAGDFAPATYGGYTSLQRQRNVGDVSEENLLLGTGSYD